MSLRQLNRQFSDYLNRFQVPPLSQSGGALCDWIESGAGRYLIQREQQLLSSQFDDLPGYHLMQLGLTGRDVTPESFARFHRFSFHPAEALRGQSALAEFDELPLPADIVDVALVQHALEFSARPRRVLAEVSRVTAPGGHLLLFLFNPFGPAGLAKLPAQLFSAAAQHRFHSLRKGRMLDWLPLLQFQVEAIYHGAYNPLLDREGERFALTKWEKIAQRIRFPLGNMYMIHAIKRVRRPLGRARVDWRPATHNGYFKVGDVSPQKKISELNE